MRRQHGTRRRPARAVAQGTLLKAPEVPDRRGRGSTGSRGGHRGLIGASVWGFILNMNRDRRQFLETAAAAGAALVASGQAPAQAQTLQSGAASVSPDVLLTNGRIHTLDG